MSQVNPKDSRDSFWWRLVHLDPAVYRGIIMAVVLLLVSVGIAVSDNIPNAVIGVVAAVFALVQAMWTKNAVVPNDKVVSYLPDPVNAPGVVYAGAAVTTASDDAVLDAARMAGG